MNIFILDTDIEKCAEYHCDKHVVKMILETTQLLCTANNLLGGKSPYKSTHTNHPCAIWARESRSNWLWLHDLGMSLCREYTHRYGKLHKCQYVLEHLKIPKSRHFNSITMTPFALAMPNEYKTKDPVESYRNYYINEKKDLHKWTKRNKPFWV
jgi:hypothetical protein